jgi:hypothetical protein
MNCQEIEEKLPDYLDGTLHPDNRELVKAHLMGCERCQAQQASWGQFVSRLKQATANDPGDAFFQGLSARIRQGVEREQKRMDCARQPVKKAWFQFSLPLPSFQMGAYACAALMIATVGLSLFFKNKEMPMTPVLSPAVGTPTLEQVVRQANLSDAEGVEVLFDLMDENNEDLSDDLVLMTSEI